MCHGAWVVKKWNLVFTKQAQKDAKKLSQSGLRPQAEKLLKILEQNPFQNSPSYEKLVGDLLASAPAVSIFNIIWCIKFSMMCKL